MKLLPIPLFIFLLLTIFSCQHSAQHQQGEKELLAEKIDSLVSNYYTQQQFSGAILIADEGEIILQQEYGFTDIDSTYLINTSSVFEIASISKQFTALLVMKMKEKGALSYNDKLTKFFPELPYSNISIRNLLTHTSGLSERHFFGWAGQQQRKNPKKIFHNEDILKYLTETKPEPVFEPGAKWEYSNVGYFLLALILQEVSDMHYISLLKQEILEPLKMNNSGIYSEKFKGTEMDTYTFGKLYNPKDSVYISSYGMTWSDSLYGSVGILSNTTDLLKWDKALYNDQLVDKETMTEALSSYPLADGSSSNYGFGWYVKEEFLVDGINRGKRLDHNGLWPGYESSIVRYIDHEKTIIILANQSPSVKDKLIEEISSLIFETKD